MLSKTGSPANGQNYAISKWCLQTRTEWSMVSFDPDSATAASKFALLTGSTVIGLGILLVGVGVIIDEVYSIRCTFGVTDSKKNISRGLLNIFPSWMMVYTTSWQDCKSSPSSWCLSSCTSLWRWCTSSTFICSTFIFWCNKACK